MLQAPLYSAQRQGVCKPVRFCLCLPPKVNQMFSAMISRPLLLLLTFILAFGAGWAIYELRREETADAPPVATSGPAPGRTAGEAGGAERPSEQGPGAPPDPSTADQGSGEPDPAVASPVDAPPATQRPKPEVERSQAQVEGSERALPAGPTPGELAQTEEPEAGGRGRPAGRARAAGRPRPCCSSLVRPQRRGRIGGHHPGSRVQ